MRATRTQIVEAAAMAFAEGGYHGATLADVGHRLGLSKSAVLYHFDTKDQLLEEVLSPLAEAMHAWLDTWTEAPATHADRMRFLTQLMEVELQHVVACQAMHNDRSVWRRGEAGRLMVANFSRLIALLSGPMPTPMTELRAHASLALAFRAVSAGIDTRGSIGSIDSDAGRAALRLCADILAGAS